jgi:hypothetical protein
MARLLAFPLIVAGLIAVWAVSTTETQAHAKVGDVNCSNEVDSIDATLVLQYGAGLLMEYACPDQGDTNGDGVSDALDAALILQFSAGLITELELPDDAEATPTPGQCPDGFIWNPADGHCESTTCPPGLVFNPKTLHCEYP